MNPMSRLFNGLFVLASLLLASTNLPAEWLLELCPLPNDYGECTSLLETQLHTEQMARLAQSSMERVYCKEKVAEALTSGKMSLLEAAACFRTLHEDPNSWRNPFSPRLEYNDGEGWCREVIQWTETRTRLMQSPYQADLLRDRLEAELQEQMEHCRSVKLPE